MNEGQCVKNHCLCSDKILIGSERIFPPVLLYWLALGVKAAEVSIVR